ncbi:MAG: hypothetical protein J6V40_00485 [Clostridia bacterium]|nr:hypothetical protein [Clostridia bacterium]
MANDLLVKAYIATVENKQDLAPSAKQIPYGNMIVIHNFKTNAYSLVKVDNAGKVIGDVIPLHMENPFFTNPENGRLVCYNVSEVREGKDDNYHLDSQGKRITTEQALYLQKITGAKTAFSEIAKLQSFETGDMINDKTDIATVLSNLGDLTPNTLEEFDVLGSFVQALLTSGNLHVAPTSEVVALVVKHLSKIKAQVESHAQAEKARQEKLADSLNTLDALLNGETQE